MRAAYLLLSMIAMLTLLAVAAPSEGARCDADAVPAATLLVPYFEVDLDRANGRTTLFSITNQSSEPALVKVVLWTDWAIHTLDFEVYLAGWDIQSLNVRDIFSSGRLPRTGAGVSPHGERSTPPVEFAGCNQGAEAGSAPVYAEPALDTARREELRAFHTGSCSGGLRASNPSSIARGYITIDVVRRCSTLTPADPGYFGPANEGVASNRNVLTGDYFLVDAEQNFAQGEQAVHVEAFPGTFEPGDYTFYKRYVGGSATDAREPLATQYSVRHLVGGGFDGGTHLIVWRDTGSPDSEPLPCDGGPPDWFGLGGLESFRIFFDEEGSSVETFDSCSILPPCDYPTAWATQTVVYNPEMPVEAELVTPFPFGMTYLTVRRAAGSDPASWPILQGWVSVIHSAKDRFSVGQRAIRLDSACDPGPLLLSPK